MLFLAAVAAACTSHQLDYHDKPGGHIEAPPDGQASVVFVRARYDIGQAFAIFDGESFVTLLGPDTYYVHSTTPGPHRFKSRVGRAWQHLNADLEADLVYFAAIRSEPIFFGVHRFELQPVLRGTRNSVSLKGWLARAIRIEPNQAAFDWFGSHEQQLIDEIREDSPGPRHYLPGSAGREPR